MSRLFISHSSSDSVAAIAFKQWLGANGWADADVFLDLENIGAGEPWKEALRKAHSRCEAVVLLASPDALSSPECLSEVRRAEDFGKEIIVVLLRDLTIDDRRLDSYKERQIVDLSAPPQAHVEQVEFRGAPHEVRFNNEALAKVKDYLFRRGITSDSFPWPPHGKPDAEPFPGLSAFSEDDAGIFFGRDADILTGLDEFRLLRRKGSPRFLAIQAASGAGKSSFLRAGLWPRLCRDPDFAPVAIVRPAQGILTGPEGLSRKLAAHLSRPGAAVNPGDIDARLLAEDAAKTVAEFAKLMTAAAAKAHGERRVVNPDAPPPALIIAIDQAEELLAAEDAEESQRFLSLLAGLMRDPPQGVEPFALLTVRVDSATRLFQAIVEHKLEAPKTLTLLPLPQTSYRDVILKPIEVIARRGQRITISAALAERLVADATGADALPLLAFTLSYLYQGFAAGGAITLEQYEAIGGVAGSIDKALKQALLRPGDAPAIPGAKEEQLACLRATFIPWLARIDPATGEPARRVARRDEFIGASQAMADRLVKARLLVADHRAGIDVVEVAHESLLRQWPTLTSWLQAVADDLRVVDAVERAAGEWVRNGRLAAWLDHRADRLSAAERIASREDFKRRLGVAGLEYLAACRARETRQRRLAQIAAWAVAAVFAIFSVLLFAEWQRTVAAQRETQASLSIAQSQLDLGNGNVGAAIERARSAFRAIPSPASRSALLQAVMELSPNATAVVALGNDTSEALAWSSGDHVQIATGSGKLRTFDATKPTAALGDWDLPRITRAQDGNRAVVRALSPLGSERMLVVFDEGSVGVYRAGDGVLQLQAPKQEISVNPTQHAVAVGRSGTLIALATTDATIMLYRCNWSDPARATPACDVSPLGQARGRVVAVSPDDTRVAVGDHDGTVMVYDLAGKAVGGSIKLNASINALGFAEQHDWLAVGTTSGEVAVFDTGAEPKSRVDGQTFGTSSITALAWSPKEPSLAFVCNGVSICLWRSNAEADQRHPFKPAMRFEGHRLGITRLSFAPSGDRLASGASDGTIRVWSLAQDTDATFALFADDAAKISTVAVSPDRQWAAGGGMDGEIALWDVKTGAASALVRPSENSEVSDLAWNRTGALAALRDNDTIDFLSADAQQQLPTRIEIKTRAGHHLGWTDDGSMIAVPMGEGGVILLDPKSPEREPLRLSDGDRKDETWGVASIPGSSLLLVSYISGDIKIWDLTSKRPVGVMRNTQTTRHDRIGVGSLSVGPDRRLLATSSGDSFVTVYDIGQRTAWRVLNTDSPGILTVAFSPNGEKLAALGSDNRLYIWTISKDSAEPYLNVGVISRRAIVGDAANRGEQASWLAWLSDDRIAVAVGDAAISVLGIDPSRWLKRVDAIAVVTAAPLN